MADSSYYIGLLQIPIFKSKNTNLKFAKYSKISKILRNTQNTQNICKILNTQFIKPKYRFFDITAFFVILCAYGLCKWLRYVIK